jgi:hypothetical protein
VRKLVYKGVPLVIALLTCMAVASDGVAGNGRPAWDRYEVLVTRNMFSRVRGRPVSRVPDRTAPPVPVAPERYVVLTGIAQQGDASVAFLEDLRSGETWLVRAGEETVRGSVRAVSASGLSYEWEGGTVEVALGETLEGHAGSEEMGFVGATEVSGVEDGGAGVSVPASPVGSSEADLLERLRQRRQEELGE